MCCTEGKTGCTIKLVVKILLIVGGLNWGLVGAGMLMGSDWNVVNMLLGSWPAVEAVVYVIVGAAAIADIFGCSCSKCKTFCGHCEAPASAPSSGSQNM